MRRKGTYILNWNLSDRLLQDNCVFYEVEMEDMKEESLPDIDTSDKKNPLAVVDYVEDIYSYYWKTEVIVSLHL